MSYRNDLAAAQARIQDLESQIKKQKNTALAKIDNKAIERSSKSNAFLGAPTTLTRTRTLKTKVDKELFAKMVMVLRKSYGQPGVISELGNSFTWSTELSSSGNVGNRNRVTLYIDNFDNSAEIRMEHSLGNTAGSIYGGGGMGVGLGVGTVPAIMLASAMPAALLIAVPLWLTGVYAACRKVYKSVAQKRDRDIQDCLDALAQIAEAN